MDTVGLDSEMIRKYVKYLGEQRTADGTAKFVLKKKRGQLKLSLPPLGARQTHPLLGVNPIPPFLRVDPLLNR